MTNQAVAEFRKNLRTKGIGPGARWLKADFHVHLPTSHDYLYKSQDANRLLGAALEANRVSFAIMLKHETFATKAELASLQEFCPSVTLIPGAEINVLVDTMSKKVNKDHYFHCIVAIDPDDPDEYGYLLRSAKEKLHYREGDYPAGFRSSVVDVARHFRSAGALFIPAHLHQAKQPHLSRSIDDVYDDETFLGFLDNREFSALEVRQLGTAEFFNGSGVTAEGRKIPVTTCVRSSDAHHHDAVGSKGTWVRAERPTFGELTAALALPHRVRLDDPSASRHARVIGMHVTGPYFGDAWIQFNEGLNALIGGKGSGKTALLECLRFALNTPVPSHRVDEVRKHREHILGSSGIVECLVEDQNGEALLIARRADASDRLSLSPENGELEVRPASAGQVFPISILGWHEIESVADRAAARVELLDRAGDPGVSQAAYAAISQQVAKARDTLPTLQTHIRRLSAGLEELWILRRKRATLTMLGETQLSDLQNQYDWFLHAEQRLDQIESFADAKKLQMSDAIVSRLEFPLQERPGGSRGPIDWVHTQLASSLASLSATERQSVSALEHRVDGVSGVVHAARQALAREFQTFRDEVYAPAVSQLKEEEREILTRQIQILEETKRLPSIEARCSEQLREVRQIAQMLSNCCNEVCIIRQALADRRAALVQVLNQELPGIRLEFRRSKNQETRDRLAGAYPGEGIRFLGYIDEFAGQDAYERLRELFGRVAGIDLDQDKWVVNQSLLDARFVAVLDVIDDDDVGMYLEVGNRGYVEIQSLSAGQRCVTAFPLLLRNSRGPLVIDQPEDNLDNRYIADSIGPDLLLKKLSQQYLVTSHNANLVVLTDADLVVHVDSNGSQAEFPNAGFLAWERSAVRDAVLSVLDGGEAALSARRRKYGLR